MGFGFCSLSRPEGGNPYDLQELGCNFVFSVSLGNTAKIIDDSHAANYFLRNPKAAFGQNFSDCAHRVLHVISKKRLREAWNRDRTLTVPLATWYKVASIAKWRSINDVKKSYPKADFADPYTVFDIKGNSYRLITKIEYRKGLVFIKDVLTHAEYDKEDWKK